MTRAIEDEDNAKEDASNCDEDDVSAPLRHKESKRKATNCSSTLEALPASKRKKSNNIVNRGTKKRRVVTAHARHHVRGVETRLEITWKKKMMTTMNWNHHRQNHKGKIAVIKMQEKTLQNPMKCH